MATYLKRHIERSQDLPANLHRLFRLIKDLDEKVTRLQEEIDAKCKQQLQLAAARKAGVKLPPAAGSSPSKKQKVVDEASLAQEVQAGMQQILNLAEEKIKVAGQLYDAVDTHIRQLDDDLRAFDAEIQQDRKLLKLKDGQTACGVLGVPVDAKLGRPASALADKAKALTRSRRAEEEAAAAAAAAAAAVAAPGGTPAALPEMDYSGPRYCVCGQPSYGEMVGCDNEDCSIEWFHLGCVGLSAPPKGKWFCPMCKPSSAKSKKGGAKG